MQIIATLMGRYFKITSGLKYMRKKSEKNVGDLVPVRFLIFGHILPYQQPSKAKNCKFPGSFWLGTDIESCFQVQQLTSFFQVETCQWIADRTAAPLQKGNIDSISVPLILNCYFIFLIAFLRVIKKSEVSKLFSIHVWCPLYFLFCSSHCKNGRNDGSKGQF